MRKDVKRARLWLIHNLTHRVKKLRSKKGTDQEKMKNSEKAQRLCSEILLLKKIDVDEVSKFALCSQHSAVTMEKDFNKLAVEQRAMLRLATHKLVQAQVFKFREAHAVPLDRLIVLVRSLGLQYQKKKQKIPSGPSEPDNMLEAPFQPKCDLRQTTPCPPKETPKSCIKEKEVEENPLQQPSSLCQLVSSSEEVAENGTFSRELPAVKPKKKAANDKSSSKCDNRNAMPAQPNCEDGNINNGKKQKTRVKVVWPESEKSINKKIGTIEVKQLHLDKLDSDIVFAAAPIPSVALPSSLEEKPKDSFFLGGIDASSDSDDANENSGQQSSYRRIGKTTRNQFSSKPRVKNRNSDRSKELRDEIKANKLANHTPLGKNRQLSKMKDSIPTLKGN